MASDEFIAPPAAKPLLAAVIAGSVVVALVATRDTEVSQTHAGRHEPAEVMVDAPPARSYRELRERPWPAHTQWSNILASLPARLGILPETDRVGLRARRAERRAFDGAPPTVPHPVDQRGFPACLACHDTGMALPHGPVASAMSHPLREPCTQCHVTAVGPLAMHGVEAGQWAGSGFAGLDSVPGRRAWVGAPPAMPHPTFMRERCLSCHGPTGPTALRTTHPERQVCQQCHALSAVAEQSVAANPPEWR